MNPRRGNPDSGISKQCLLVGTDAFESGLTLSTLSTVSLLPMSPVHTDQFGTDVPGSYRLAGSPPAKKPQPKEILTKRFEKL